MTNIIKSKLITVETEFKTKGFRSENFSKIDTTKEFNEIKSRINQLKSNAYYQKLTEKEKNIVSKFVEGYEKTSKQESLEDDEIVLSGHEIVEFSKIADPDVFRYLVYRYKYLKLISKKVLKFVSRV